MPTLKIHHKMEIDCFIYKLHHYLTHLEVNFPATTTTLNRSKHMYNSKVHAHSSVITWNKNIWPFSLVLCVKIGQIITDLQSFMYTLYPLVCQI
jgi:hypothetical protein